jgi:poly(A) polymerase
MKKTQSKILFQKRLASFDKKLDKEPFLKFIPKFLKKFPKAELYLVGGAVRDAAQGTTKQKDYDFVVRNVSPRELKKFLSSLGSVNLVGKHFGVYKFTPRGFKLEEAIDIALPRTEHSIGIGGYRDFKVQSDSKMPIKKDLSRRDFTVNAMALKLKIENGKLKIAEIIEPYNGLSDLSKNIIRTVGKPEERFKEDYSRMLRAMRFACQLSFNIEKKTFAALKKKMEHINDEKKIKNKKERVVPFETIAREFLKAFYKNPVLAFDLYDKSGAFDKLMPEILEMKKCPQPKIFHSEGDVWVHTKMSLANLYSRKFKKQFKKDPKIRAELIVAVLLHDIGKPRTLQTPKKNKVDRIRFNEHDVVGAEMAYKISRRLKLDSLPQDSFLRVNPENLVWLISKHLILVYADAEEMRPATIEKYFFNPQRPGGDLLKLAFVDANATIPPSGKPDLKNFHKLAKRIKEIEKLTRERKKLPPPILDGHEIMKKFKIKEGPQVGELIVVLREAQLGGKVGKEKSKKERKEKAYEILKKYLKKKKK